MFIQIKFIEGIFENLLKGAGLNTKSTLNDLYNHSNIELNIFTVNMTKFKLERLSYKTNPNNNKLVLNKTEMFYDNEDPSYYLIDSDKEPIAFYMLYDKSESNLSDGNKIPIDNTLFYFNQDMNENAIYGTIENLDVNKNIKVKDIENKLFEGEYIITR